MRCFAIQERNLWRQFFRRGIRPTSDGLSSGFNVIVRRRRLPWRTTSVWFRFFRSYRGLGSENCFRSSDRRMVRRSVVQRKYLLEFSRGLEIFLTSSLGYDRAIRSSLRRRFVSALRCAVNILLLDELLLYVCRIGPGVYEDE